MREEVGERRYEVGGTAAHLSRRLTGLTSRTRPTTRVSRFMRRTTLAEAEYIASHLRESDRQECLALGVVPHTGAMLSFLGSELVLTGYAHGRPVIMAGVEEHFFGDADIIWALGTPECDEIPVSMVKFGKRVVKAFLARHPKLENHCDSRNLRTVKWLKLLGFTVEKPAPFGPLGSPFCHLHIERN